MSRRLLSGIAVLAERPSAPLRLRRDPGKDGGPGPDTRANARRSEFEVVSADGGRRAE